ncbi:unnamed protein product [Rangifer tarandus platyrhynchus]|uniref:Uncharacterized protein n=2 Tax=Rangifer tarandus platyrhynchus TaxID=3082113 RepID=A0ABN8ZZC9_RANTA|nr:unnamed protein product [Rangifer tarandus platyrhynchus]
MELEGPVPKRALPEQGLVCTQARPAQEACWSFPVQLNIHAALTLQTDSRTHTAPRVPGPPSSGLSLPGSFSAGLLAPPVPAVSMLAPASTPGPPSFVCCLLQDGGSVGLGVLPRFCSALSPGQCPAHSRHPVRIGRIKE